MKEIITILNAATVKEQIPVKSTTLHLGDRLDVMSVEIPPSVHTLHLGSHTSLVGLTIPDTVKTVICGSGNNLLHITIPASVTSVGLGTGNTLPPATWFRDVKRLHLGSYYNFADLGFTCPKGVKELHMGTSNVGCEGVIESLPSLESLNLGTFNVYDGIDDVLISELGLGENNEIGPVHTCFIGTLSGFEKDNNFWPVQKRCPNCM